MTVDALFGDDEEFNENDNIEQPILTSAIRKEKRKKTKEEKEKIKAELKHKKYLRTKVKTYVLEELGGTPENYAGTKVKHLWDNNYRVNILVGRPKSESRRDAQVFKFNERTKHSFFVTVDEVKDGVVCESKDNIPLLYNNFNDDINAIRQENSNEQE